MTRSAGGQLDVADFTHLDAWTTWSSITYSGITVGNGTVKAAYCEAGQTITVRWSLVWGSTTSFSGTPLITLPVTPHSDYGAYDCIGSAALYDSSAGSSGRLTATAYHYSGGQVFFVANHLTSGQTVISTSPFTWTTSDQISMVCTYEAA